MRLLLIFICLFSTFYLPCLNAQASLKKIEKILDKSEASAPMTKDLSTLHELMVSATQDSKLAAEAKTWYLSARAFNLLYRNAATYPAVGETKAIEQVRRAGARAEQLGDESQPYVVLTKAEVSSLYNDLLNKGTKAYNQQQYDLTLGSFEQATVLAPRDTTALLYAATLAAETGKPKLARTLFERLLVLTPDNFDANYSYALLLSQEADPYYQQVNALSDADYPQKSPPLIEQANQALARSLPYWEAARNAQPTDKNVLLALKMVYTRLANKDALKEVNTKLAELGY
ncbi:MAG: hypothetical protein AAF840_14055 [Bacteroidota bacterium]